MDYEHETWIYLDHWALGDFATAAWAPRRARLLAAIARGAYVAFSPMNALEFLRTGRRTIEEVQSVLRAVGPRVRLIDTDPIAVLTRAAGGRSERAAAVIPDLVVGLDGIDLLSSFGDRDNPMRAEYEAALEARAAGMRADRAAGGEFDPPIPGSRVDGCWRALARSVLDERFEIDGHDAADYLHAVVPIAVCNFALLDGGWTELARRVSDSARRAEVFSGKKGQIEAFLDALERWPSPPPEAK